MQAQVGARSVDDLTAALREAAEEDERVWGISPRTSVLAQVVPLLGAAVVVVALVHRPVFRWITREDGPLEWAQLGFDLVAAAAATWVAVALHRRGMRGASALWALFALVCVFIAGEEISWGQRLVGRETPEALRAVNHQEETNVHNIRPVQDSINVAFMVLGAYGSIGAVVLRRWVARRRDRPAGFDLFVAPYALFSLFFLVFAYKLTRLTVLPSPRFVIVKYGEYVELCTAVALAAFAVLTARRLRAARSTAADRATASG